jgi:hypothetical protein
MDNPIANEYNSLNKYEETKLTSIQRLREATKMIKE